MLTQRATPLLTFCYRPWWLLALAAGLQHAAQAQGRTNYADWRLEWAEEFNGPLDTVALGARWQFAYPWGRAADSDTENGFFSAQALRAGEGVLNMCAVRRATPRHYRGRTLRYDAPMLISHHPVDSLRPASCNPDEGFSYGLFEARVRQPADGGMVPAFWLYGGAPDEVDIFECSAEVASNNVHLLSGGYWRPARRATQVSQNFFFSTDPAGNLHQQFHTYGLSWLPDELIFYFDGIPIRRETRYVPAGCAMRLILSVEVHTWARATADTMAVDYVRVYRPRHLPGPVAGERPRVARAQTKQAWLPAEAPPTALDQGTHQTWQLAPARRNPHRLTLELIDNFNPPADQLLPLPLAGHWAPAWYQAGHTPDLRVQAAAPDSVHWTVSTLLGEPVARGVAAAQNWHPRWPALAPGSYALHLRQGGAAISHPLAILARPADSVPTPAWLLPLPPAAAAAEEQP